MCCLTEDKLFFSGVLCLALCFVMRVPHGVVVLCNEVIQNCGKYWPSFVSEKGQAVVDFITS